MNARRVGAWPGMEVIGTDARTVVTTGATWVFDDDGMVCATQRIGQARPLFRLHPPYGAWAQDGGASFVRDDLRATVRDDSVVELVARHPVALRVELLFPPEHVARHRGRWMAVDASGGIGVYPLRPRLVTRTREITLAAGDACWVAAFPSREPSPLREAQEVAHEGRPAPFPDAAYPGDDLIAESAEHCDVFALHAYFWAACDRTDRPRFGRYVGRRCSWRTRRHEPADAERFAALRESVHRHGMELVVYVSPEYARVADIHDEMRRIVDEYEVDGLYLDGVADDLPTLYETVRSARDILGPDRILYLNATSQPFGTPRVFAPFVDAQCDFVLRGDAGRGGLARDAFLRWAVSGRGLSSTASLWCHYGSAGRPVLRETVPPEADVRAAVRAGVKLWRRAGAWRETGGDVASFDSIYADAKSAAPMTP